MSVEVDERHGRGLVWMRRRVSEVPPAKELMGTAPFQSRDKPVQHFEKELSAYPGSRPGRDRGAGEIDSHPRKAQY